MSAALFMDHSDFQKARKALIACSVALIIISSLNIGSQEIVFFELKLTVDQKLILTLGRYALIYLSLNFLLRTYLKLCSDSRAVKLDLLYTVENAQNAVEQKREKLGADSTEARASNGYVMPPFSHHSTLEMMDAQKKAKADNLSINAISKHQDDVLKAKFEIKLIEKCVAYCIDMLPPILLSAVSFYFIYDKLSNLSIG